MMTPSMGSASANLFPTDNGSVMQTDTIDTAGTRIEQQIMDLVEEIPQFASVYHTSIIDCKFQNFDLSL